MNIDLFGNHSLYSNTFPAGSVPQGTITLDDGSTGAYVYMPATKTYCMVNAGAVRSIDQSALRAIIGKA